MDIVSAENFLRDQVPPAQQALFAPTLKLAYDAATLHIKNEPVLQIPSATDNHGRIRSWSVDWAFQKLIESGRWRGVDFRWADYAQPTGRYLEVRLSHSVMSISQISDPTKQPRNVVFRRNRRMNNQHFFPLPEFDDERQVDGLPALLLIHGHKELNFAHLGVPNSTHNLGYLYRTPNLLMTPHVVSSDVPPTEQTDIDAVMTFKEDIDKWRFDNGE